MLDVTPAALGYRFPAEFALHHATWLSWPHNPDTWPGKIDTIFPLYARFIDILSQGEFVHINVADEVMKIKARNTLIENGVLIDRVKFFCILLMMRGAAIMGLLS